MKPKEFPIYITPTAYEKFVTGANRNAVANIVAEITNKVEVKDYYSCLYIDGKTLADTLNVDVARWKIINEQGEEEDALFIVTDHSLELVLRMLPEHKKQRMIEEIIESSFLFPIT